MSAGADCAGGPLARVLERVERVRRSGKGYVARCPAHADRTASLSLAEGGDGIALIHCFGGCAAADVLGAVGLQLADLYPERVAPSTPEQRREARAFARMAKLRAVLNVLATEAAIVTIAAGDILAERGIDFGDFQRLVLAEQRIADARAELR